MQRKPSGAVSRSPSRADGRIGIVLGGGPVNGPPRDKRDGTWAGLVLSHPISAREHPARRVAALSLYPDNALLTNADALAKSILPAYLPFSAPITLPMSFIPPAPVSCIAWATAALTSSSDICFGR